MLWLGYHFLEIIDFLIVGIVILMIYRLLRKTQMMKVIIGITFIYLLSILFEEFKMMHSAGMLRLLSVILTLAVVFLFNLELRMMMKKIGAMAKMKKKEKKVVHDSIKRAVFAMSRKRIGALIIIDYEKSIPYISDDLIEIDAKCTNELLQTIFFPKTALHDGAVIIHDDKIAYAGCKLPLSGKKREGSEKYGTRHMAAIENSTNYEILVIVVSEETGDISISKNGNLIKIADEKEYDLYIKRLEEVN